MWEAIIGVCGTLAGTILGWVLAKQKKGKLDIKISNFYDEKSRAVEAKDKRIIYNLFDFKVDVKLYNNGEKTRTIRDLEIVFKDGNGKILLSKPLLDFSTGEQMANCSWKYDKVNVLNINGLTGRDVFGVCQLLHNDNVKIISAKKVYLHYKDEKFKVNELYITDKDYSQIFSNIYIGEK